MNYKSKNPIISIRMDRDIYFKLKKILKDDELISQKAKQIISDFVNGKFNPSNENNINEKIKEANFIKSQNHNELQAIRKRKLEAETKISEYHANHLDVIGSMPSNQAKEAIKHYVSGTRPFDDQAIRCPDCSNWQSNTRHPIEWQIDSITKHIQNFHNRNFSELEAKELAELIK